VSVPCDARLAPQLRVRVHEIVSGAPRSPLELGVELAHLLARAGAGERRVLWSLAWPWLPATIEAASSARPALGTGWLLDAHGNAIAGGAYPIGLAREALALRDDDPVILVRPRRHPARSLRGAIRYMDRLWRLRRWLEIDARRDEPRSTRLVHTGA